MKKARARNPKQTSTKLPPKKTPKAARTVSRKESPGLETKELTRTNGVIELDPHLLNMRTARSIAKSLKRSADTSPRLEHSPFHSAMSVLNALINNVDVLRVRLDAAKKELRILYHEMEEKAGEHEPVPPQEFARQRSAPKGQGAPKNDRPADNRPRSRPNKVV